MVRCTKDNSASYRGSKPCWKCNFTMTVLTQSSSGQNKKTRGRISHLLSWRIFGRSFWCSWNSPRSMLPPSPEGGWRVPVSCAIACKINPDLDDKLVREKNDRILTWVWEMWGSVNADYCCDQWDRREKDQQEPESMSKYSLAIVLTNIMSVVDLSNIFLVHLSNILEIFLHSSPIISFLSSCLYLRQRIKSCQASKVWRWSFKYIGTWQPDASYDLHSNST